MKVKSKFALLTAIVLMGVGFVLSIGGFSWSTILNHKSVLSNSNQLDEKNNVVKVNKTMPIPVFCCYIGRPKYDCMRGLWLCDCWGCSGFCSAKQRPNEQTQRRVDILFDRVNKKATFSFLEDLPESGPWFEGENAYSFHPKTAEEYGFKSIVILPGKYPIDYSKNPHGTVTLDAQIQ